MSSPAPSALVALAVGETRAVVPLELVDPRALEIETTLPLRMGETLDIQVRCTAGARRLLIEVSVRVEAMQGTPAGRRARLAFQQPELPAVAELLGFAHKMGRGAPEKVAPPTADEAVGVRASAPLATFCVDAAAEGVGRLVLDEVLAGSLLVAARDAPEKNAEVLVRLDLPEGRSLWLCGRVVYHGQTRSGHPGVGLALEPLPEAIRRDIRALRR